MRTSLPIKKSFAKISLLFIALAFASCNSLKRVDEGQLLIKRNTIWADSVKVVQEEIEKEALHQYKSYLATQWPQQN